MRKQILTSLFAVALTTIVSAGPEPIQSSGKEMKETVAPAPTCDFSWTGFYIGGRIGYGWGNGDTHAEGLPPALFDIDPGSHDLSADGFIGGGEVGFNWQLGRYFLIGAEADFSGSTMSDDFTAVQDVPQTPGIPADFHTSQDINWLGTVRGRLGFVPWCRMLVYGTGGFAFADVDNSSDIDFRPFPGGVHHYPASNHDTQTGWTAGGGLEFAISRHWTIKAEYLYVDLGDESSTGNPLPTPNPPFQVRYNWSTQFSTVTGGLNFKF